MPRAIPAGSRVIRQIALGYAARVPTLLLGPTGIGKSELSAQAASDLGVQHQVIDLTICEPADLLGLPHIDHGVTRYAPPAILPRSGSGLLVFEELNRAEAVVRQPILQLLTTRRLHDYELPRGWSMTATANPDNDTYDVFPLDPALLARFLIIPVRADFDSWMAWAHASETHPRILRFLARNQQAFWQAPPRSWTYASRLLSACTDEQTRNPDLLFEGLAGLLPEPLAIEIAISDSQPPPLALTHHVLLSRLGQDHSVLQQLHEAVASGRSDLLVEITVDLENVVRQPDFRQKCDDGVFSLENLELALSILPGDLRDQIQAVLLERTDGLELLKMANFMNDPSFGVLLARRLVRRWRENPHLRHRTGWLTAALARRFQDPALRAAFRSHKVHRKRIQWLLRELEPVFAKTILDRIQEWKLP